MAEHWRIDAFELWCWRRLLRVPWTARRSNQSILKETNPEYSLKGWCWSWSSKTLATWCEELNHWKRPGCWERLRAGGEVGSRGWDVCMAHHLKGHEFEQTPGDSDWQGSLVCCSSWGHKESDTTEQLNNNTTFSQNLSSPEKWQFNNSSTYFKRLPWGQMLICVVFLLLLSAPRRC